jgi:hypothetical protein
MLLYLMVVWLYLQFMSLCLTFFSSPMMLPPSKPKTKAPRKRVICICVSCGCGKLTYIDQHDNEEKPGKEVSEKTFKDHQKREKAMLNRPPSPPPLPDFILPTHPVSEREGGSCYGIDQIGIADHAQNLQECQASVLIFAFTSVVSDLE